MIKKILIGAMLVSLAACTPSDEAQQKASQGLVISAAQVKAPLIGKTTTAAFFEIANNTKVDDALIGAESPIAERIEIHLTSIDDNGVMKMRRQVSVDMN